MWSVRYIRWSIICWGKNISTRKIYMSGVPFITSRIPENNSELLSQIDVRFIKRVHSPSRSRCSACPRVASPAILTTVIVSAALTCWGNI